MAVDITVKVDDREINKLLRKMHHNGKNMKPLMTVFFAKVHQDVMLNFRLQGAPNDIFSGPPSYSRTKWKNISAKF